MADFIVYPKRGRMLMLEFFSLLFVLLGILMSGFAITGEASIWIGLPGAFIAVFFGFCALFYIREILIHKPALIISSEGIWDRSSFIGAGLVHWDDIEGLDFITFSGQLYLSIFTYDPQLIINRTSGIKRTLNKMNRSLLPSQVNIPVKNLACTMDELVEEIDKRWQLKMAAEETAAE